MVREEEYTPPFDLEEQSAVSHTRPGSAETPAALADNDSQPAELVEDDLVAARQAWEGDASEERVQPASESSPANGSAAHDQPAAGEADSAEILDQPFVGRWNQLVSNTNWEKGRIITQWRAALIDSGAAPTQYSDEAWARRVGGVTASHVGRLRRVYDTFASSHETYRGLYWTHFLVALDWEDAPLWLEGAVQSGWSVAAMRQQRWQATGADEATRRAEGELVTTDLDEDFDAATAGSTQPAQGGGATSDYEGGPATIGSGPAVEGPDFGDEESLNRIGGDFDSPPLPDADATESADDTAAPLVQPFAGLPELPSDLAEAVELLKLAVLRHKTTGWKEVSAETVGQYLQAFAVLVEARGK